MSWRPVKLGRAGPVTAGCFFAAFFMVWAPITLVFDAVIAYGLVRQSLATAYPAAPATITSSEVKTSRSSKGGTTYRADISFRYTVAGREYTSEKWRYAQWSSSGTAESRSMVARYPAGSSAVARYDPNNPADAILEPGIRKSDALLVLFFAPFNAVIAGGAAIGVLAIRKRRLAPVRPGGLIITNAGGVIRARLPHMVAPSVASIAVAAVLCVVGVFAVGIPYDFGPPIAVSMGALGAAILAGLLWYATARVQIASGRRDLVLDPVRRVLTLPRCIDGGRPEIPYGSIAGVVYRPGASTRNGRKSTQAVLRAGGFEYRLVERYERKEALAIGNWLLAQTGQRPASEEALPTEAALADPE